jgi:SAM-dependent methyltransferase
LRELEARYPNELAVVGVHSGKYPTERETPRIRDACIRLGASHPTVNDRQFRLWRAYAVRAWPTLVAVDPRGSVIGMTAGEFTADALAPFVERVIAVDESNTMLDAARLRLADRENVELRGGRLEDLPVEDGELDAAILSLVLHFVVDPAAVLAEAARTLKPGGRLLVVDMVPHEREEYRTSMGHLWLGFDAAQITAWLEVAGFTDVRITPLAPDPHAKGPGLFTARAARRSGMI